ncbi:MAG: biotin/lipoyl-containing protein [Gammaproteobacteria bacterium]
MSLTAADVAEILRLLEQSSFDELNLEMNGMKLSLKRGASVGAASAGAAGALRNGDAADAALGARGGAVASPTSSLTGSAVTSSATSMATSASAAADSGAARSASPDSAASYAGPARTTDPNLHDVPSPLLGTFYRSPKPGAPPFVEVGSPVTEESIVAIIEVMKLMNTVRAGARGTVAEILPTDGTLVEYDQPILRIRKSG